MRNKYKIALITLATVASLVATPLASVTKAEDSVFKPTNITFSSVPYHQETITFLQGWNLFSFPATPLEVDPAALFTGINIDGNLYSYNPHSQDLEKAFAYDAGNPDKFGPIDQSLAYWLRVDKETTLTYDAVDTYRTKSAWLHKGMNMIAYPYEAPQSVASLWVRNHATGQEITFTEARHQNIVDGVIYGWDNVHQGLFDTGLEEDWASNTTLEPKHGYWFNGLQEGYEIVVKKPAAS